MTLLPPTASQLERMKLELSQPEETTRRDIALLKEWLAKQPHLPKHMDDVRLGRFLYGCKYSLERAKRVLETYYMVRATCPEIFTNRDPLLPEMQEWFKLSTFFVLPSLSPEGYRVTFFRLHSSDVTHHRVDVFFKWLLMVLDLCLLTDKCLNNIVVADMGNMTMQLYARWIPTLDIMKKGRKCVHDSLPMRVARIHFINAPSYVEKVVSLLGSFYKEKLLKRLTFNVEGTECIKNYIPEDILPFEYGGKAGKVDDMRADWIAKLVEHRDWFKNEERVSKADLSKLVTRKESLSHRVRDSVSGFSGSFRKIIID